MKAKELIKLLSEIDPETIICKETYDGEIYESEASKPSEYQSGYFNVEGEFVESGKILILN